MKLKFIYTFFATALLMVVLVANRNGRASTANADNTGAPGPNGGNALTCSECHSGGDPSTTVVTLLDSANTAVTAYMPGKTYTARVTITSVGQPEGYGFQMVALKSSDNTNTGTFADVNPNNYKLKTINATGRTFAEHAGMSATNTFNVTWTAPAAGTGAVRFFASGNAVNDNSSTGGDGPSNTQLTVQESSVSTVAVNSLTARVIPTVLTEVTRSVQVTVTEGGVYRFSLWSLNGQNITTAEYSLQAGTNTVEMPVADVQAGLYVLNIQHGVRMASVKMVKL